MTTSCAPLLSRTSYTYAGATAPSLFAQQCGCGVALKRSTTCHGWVRLAAAWLLLSEVLLVCQRWHSFEIAVQILLITINLGVCPGT